MRQQYAPNDWATEVGKPCYIFDLLLIIINVNVQTVKMLEVFPGLKCE
jgi:predicted helicase